MLMNILSFEWKYHTRHITFYVAALVFALFGYVTAHGSFGGANVYSNSSYFLSAFISMQTMNLLFVITVFCANAVLRDREHKMEELIFSTSIRKPHYVLGRFTGLFCASLFVQCCAILGMFMGHFFSVETDRLGEFSFWNYLWPLIVFALPNILLSASVLFATASVTKNVKAVYVTGISLFMVYVAGSMLGNSPLWAGSSATPPEHPMFAALLDPFNVVGFFEQTRYWTTLERNSLGVLLEGNVLYNRLLWLATAIGLFTVAYRRFAFQTGKISGSKQEKQVEHSVKPIAFKTVHTAPKTKAYRWASLLSSTRIEVSELIKSIPFVVFLLIWTLVIGIVISDEALRGVFNISFYPTTGIIFEVLSGSIISVVFFIFYSGELVWREKDVKIDEIIDTTPVPNTVSFLSKCLTLGAVVAILICVNIFIGVLLQMSRGYFNFEFGTYLTLFYYNGFPLFLYAIFCLFIQVISPNKHAGMVFSGICVFLFFYGPNLGVTHLMFLFGVGPDLLYSDMNFFGQMQGAFHWYMLYWGALSGVLGCLSFGLWKRGKFSTLLSRLKSMNSNWGTRGGYFTAAFLLLFLGSGSYIFYQTNVLNLYLTADEQMDLRADYEKKYKSFENMASLTVTHVKTDVDMFPEDMRYHVKGRYVLENKTNEPIEKILVFINPQVSFSEISVENAQITENNPRFFSRWFQFKKALMPGEKTNMAFQLNVQKSGFSKFDGENSIVSNGSYIELEKFIPRFGYIAAIELSNLRQRKKRGLEPQNKTVRFEPEKKFDYDFVWFESYVSTSSDQIALTVGELQSEWEQDGRRYFHYKTNQPINWQFAYTSGRYTVNKEAVNDIDYELYFQPGHEYNVDRIMKASQESVDYFSKSYGKYRHKHVTFIEIPRSRPGAGATAYPGLNLWTQMGFLMDLRDDTRLDLVYSSTSHEIAHQWWAHELRPAPMPGSLMLTEGLASFSATMMMEKVYGKHIVRKAFEIDQDLYFTNRGYESDVEEPVYQAWNQSYIAYRKGLLVMYALKELIGEEAINSALSNLVKKHGYPNPQANTLDLIDGLYEVSPQKYHSLIDDWFKKRMTYDLKIEDSKVIELADGRFEVTMNIVTKKFEADAKGVETPRDMNESFEVGIFTEHPDSANGEHILYLTRHTFTQETTELKFIVDKKPSHIGIDPYIYMLDRNVYDNVKEL